MGEVLEKNEKIQVIIIPRKTVWANTTQSNVVVTVDIATNRYATTVVPPKEPTFRLLTAQEIEELNEELRKLSGSYVVEATATMKSATTHGKEKKGINIETIKLLFKPDKLMTGL